MLADLSPVGIVKSDAKGNVEFVNDMWWRVMGRDPSRYTANDWPDFIHPEDRESVIQNQVRVLVTLQRFQIECRCVKEDGSIVWVMTEGVPDIAFGQDGSKELRGMYMAVVDVSERKLLEKERLEHVQRAEIEQRKRAEEAEENRRHQEMFIDMVRNMLLVGSGGRRHC